MGIHILLEDMSFRLMFLERVCLCRSCFETSPASWENMFLSEHVLWMAYFEGGYALLEDISCRNRGFTGGIALMEGMHCSRAFFTVRHILLKIILQSSICSPVTQV